MEAANVYKSSIDQRPLCVKRSILDSSKSGSNQEIETAGWFKKGKFNIESY